MARLKGIALRGVLLATLVLATIGVAVRTAWAQGGMAVTVSPLATTVAAGAEFTLEVSVSSDTPIRGAQCSLEFDPAALEVLSFEQGPLFSDWAQANGAQTLLFPEGEIKVDPVSGKGLVTDTSVVLLGDVAGGPSGSGVFLIYHVRAKTDLSDATPLPFRLQHVIISDENAVSHAAANGEVTYVDPTAVALGTTAPEVAVMTAPADATAVAATLAPATAAPSVAATAKPTPTKPAAIVATATEAPTAADGKGLPMGVIAAGGGAVLLLAIGGVLVLRKK